jgi:hypothetical protein
MKRRYKLLNAGFISINLKCDYLNGNIAITHLNNDKFKRALGDCFSLKRQADCSIKICYFVAVWKKYNIFAN